MISFRYHLVSVIAVFLAIGLGVVVGTTALNGAVLGDLRRQVTDSRAAATAGQQQVQAAQAKAGAADVLAHNYAAKIVGAALANTPVVLIAAPGATAATVSGIAAQVTAAGGTVAGQVQLSAALLDPSRANDLRSLATSVHPIGLLLPQTDDASRLTGALLGYVLFGHGAPTDIKQVLTAFSGLSMLSVTGTVAPGKAVLLIAPAASSGSDPGSSMLSSMASELASPLTGGPTVVVGDAAATGTTGLIGLIRGVDAAKRTISTVDDADTSLGQLTAVLTTAEALTGRRGDYGTAAGADAVLPTP